MPVLTPAIVATARGHNPDESATKRRWRTPPALFATLDAEYGFGLDAAAEDVSALCSMWISPEMDTLVTPWRPLTVRNCEGQRNAFANFPWGPRFSACPPDCDKDHKHHAESFPGTGAFVDRAINQLPTLDGIVLVLPTAPDTSWWRDLFGVAFRLRLLPRVAFLDGVTGIPANAPPGAGISVFELRAGFRGGCSVVLADVNGRIGR